MVALVDVEMQMNRKCYGDHVAWVYDARLLRQLRNTALIHPHVWRSQGNRDACILDKRILYRLLKKL